MPDGNVWNDMGEERYVIPFLVAGFSPLSRKCLLEIVWRVERGAAAEPRGAEPPVNYAAICQAGGITPSIALDTPCAEN